MAFRRSHVTASAAAVLIAALTPTFLLQGEADASTSVSKPAATNLALSDFASQIETLGVLKYPDSFAEADLLPSGVTKVYVSAPSDSRMINAFRSLDKSNYPIEFVGVKRSYNQLDALNQRVAAATAQLRAEGIFLTQSYPDAASGTVVVDVKSPTSVSFSQLSAVKGRTVTATNYPASVSSALQAKFGSTVTFGKEVASPLSTGAGGITNGPVDRDGDEPPFANGDLITNDTYSIDCTGGWNVLNDDGKPYMLTAGHCGSGTFSTENATIGTTSSNWLTESASKPYPNAWDVQAIKINSSEGGAAEVWTSGGNLAPVTGYMIPAEGATLTVNGAKTGEQHGEVDEVDFTAEDIEDDLTGGYFNAVHQIWLENDTASPLCVNNDSGGPVYEQGSPDVKAAGIITAQGQYTENGIVVAYACAATMVSSVLSEKDLTLITS